MAEARRDGEAAALLAYLRASRDAILADLEEFVTRESPSTDKHLLDDFAEFLGEYGEQALGGRAEIVPAAEQGNHVRFTRGTSGALRPIMLLGHYDTVWAPGTIPEMPFRADDETVSGPGIFDMKGGLVQGFWALRALREVDAIEHPIVFVCNSDEEIGSPSSQRLIEEEARRAAVVLVLEPSLDGKLKTARKGVARYRIEVTGRATHAGLDPLGGVSAIDELCRIVRKLHAQSNPETGTMVNVGVIEGGTRYNVVAARASAEVDVRTVTRAEAERMEGLIRGLEPHHPDARIAVSGAIIWPPMERTETTERLFGLAHRLAAELGFELEEGLAGGASDGSFCASVGAAVLDGLGAVGGGAHALDEHLDLASVPLRAALVARLIQVLGSEERARAGQGG